MENMILSYVEEITNSKPQEDHQYILVSDFSCAPCKEKIFNEIETTNSHTIYIIVQPRNRSVLEERFDRAIENKMVFIDFEGINRKQGVIFDNALELKMRDKKWQVPLKLD
ncbi:hypothetical protein ACFOUP_04710 [Belliella kenyensis]|uniref:Uncharacterized protein n=1 Tax=Belliella kenyensis TaxID=1472724 RepID=A0ABV8EJA4_9BACT|nr:hypothetical protein [Belliella kenyensis]MCH7403467.1 hypothetical protein [Belliella kenyensis]MDN3602367.1 hypothetical protein [Belliella kenyensis]